MDLLFRELKFPQDATEAQETHSCDVIYNRCGYDIAPNIPEYSFFQSNFKFNNMSMSIPLYF